MRPLYLIDSSIYIFRAWFAVSDSVIDAHGRPNNAFTGFFDFTMRFLNEVRPRHVVFTFDESLESSFRNEIYPSYKANREPTPAELKRQFVHCRQLISALGISTIASPTYEADDLIGTLASIANQNGQAVVVVSGDKDLTQVLGDNDLWWDYAKRRRLDAQGVIDALGVAPEQVPDLLALSGDATDNIPGVPGIGAVTAAKLISHFGSVEELLASVDELVLLQGLRGASRISGLIREHAETARLSKKLTQICTTVPLPDDFRTTVNQPDLAAYNQLATELGMKAYRRSLFLDCARAMHS